MDSWSARAGANRGLPSAPLRWVGRAGAAPPAAGSIPALTKLLDEGIARGEGQPDVAAG